MIEESGVVVAAQAGIAEVEVVRRSSCGACGANTACGVSLLDRVLGRRPQRLIMGNTLDVRVGDSVIVGLPEEALIGAALAAYLLPLVGLIGGAILGEAVAAGTGITGELGPLAGGAAGFAAALLLLRRYSRRLAADERLRPRLLRRAGLAMPVPVSFPEAPKRL